MRPRTLRSSLPFLLLSVGGTTLTGCGGSDGGSPNPGPNPATVAAVVDLSWAARSRGFAGPAAALSARLTFVRAGATGSDLVTTVDRRSDPAAYVVSVPLSAPVRTGAVQIRVDYYAAAGAGGSRVAVAETNAIVRSDGTLARSDGSELGFINAETEIAALELITPYSLQVGETATLGFTARAASGGVVALSPGSATFRATGNVATTPDGTLTATGVGSGEVTVEIDGVKATAAISVSPSESIGIVTVDQPARELAFSTSRGRLLATTQSRGLNPDRLIEIDPITGAVETVYEIGGVPDAFDVSADGRTAFVGLTGAGSLVRVDLATGGVVGEPVSFGSDAKGLLAAIDVVASPTDPEAAGVSISNDGVTVGTAIVRNGAILPNRTTGTYENHVIAFNAAGTELFGFNNYTGTADFTRNAVDASGVTATERRSNLLDGNDLIVAGNRIFGRDGHVVDAATFVAAGRFDLQGGRSIAVAIDAARGKAYFLVTGASSALQLVTFDTETYARLATQFVPGGRPTFSGRRLVVVGANRLAYSTPDGIYLIDTTKI